MHNFSDFDKKIFPRDFPEEIHTESKHISKVFISFIAAYILSYVVVLTLSAFLHAFDFSSEVSYVVLTILQLSLMPLIFLLMSLFGAGIESARHPVMDKMTSSKFVALLALSIFIMMVGNVVGIYVNNILGKITGTDIENVVEEAISRMSILEIFISVVVFAPIFEELVFRKLLIDKLSRYGTSFCIVVSGFVFGLVHCNFQQFFYAFGLGAVFAYVYCIYGNIIYPIFLHMIINTIGSIVPVLLGITAVSQVTALQMIYMCIYVFAFAIGGIIFFSNRRKAKCYMVGGVLLSPYKSLFTSVGFHLAMAVIILEFSFSVFG